MKWIFLLLFFPLQIYAEYQHALVVVSDLSVQKYHIAAQDFQHYWPHQITQLDLGSAYVGKAEVQSAIMNEDIDVIYTIGMPAYQTVSQLSPPFPVIVSTAFNWRRLLAQGPLPKNHVIIDDEMPPLLQLSWMQKTFNFPLKVGVLYHSRFNQNRLASLQNAAQLLDIDLVFFDVPDRFTEDTIRAFVSSLSVLWLIPDPAVLSQQHQPFVYALADTLHIPIVTYSTAFLAQGATLVLETESRVVAQQISNLLQRPTLPTSLYAPLGSTMTLNLGAIESYRVPIKRTVKKSINRFYND